MSGKYGTHYMFTLLYGTSFLMGCMPDAPHTVSKTTNKQTYVLKHNVGNTMQHMCVVDIHFFMCEIQTL